MADLAEKLEEQVLGLPEEDRGRILLRLISSLDGDEVMARLRSRFG